MATPKPKSTIARVTKLRETDTTENNAAKLPDKHVGEVFKEAREERAMTMDMVANELMIRRFYLDALEAGSFSDLPERVYATGFVRSYATYLGLDVAKIVEQFRRDAYGTRSGNYQVDLIMPQPVIHTVVPSRSVILSAIGALVLIIGGVIFATRDKTASVTSIPTPPVEAAATEIPTPELTSAPQAAPVATTAAPTQDNTSASVTNDATATGFDLPAPPTAATTTTATSAASATTPVTGTIPAGLPAPTAASALPDTVAAPATPAAATVTTRLSVEAIESSWVEVKDGKGTVLFTSILKKGQLLPIPDQKGITLTTGNAAGLRLTLDGKVLPPLGQTNEVKRNLPLDPEKLSKL